MNIIKHLTISITFIFANQIFCMDKPVQDNQRSSSLSESMTEKISRNLDQLEIYKDAAEAYQTALQSPDIDGLTQMQKAKWYLKNQIVRKKQEIAQEKVAVNFYFLADPQVPNADKYDCLLNWQNKVEAECPLRIELMSLKLAYSYIKYEMLQHSAERIKQEIQPYFPRFILKPAGQTPNP